MPSNINSTLSIGKLEWSGLGTADILTNETPKRNFQKEIKELSFLENVGI